MGRTMILAKPGTGKTTYLAEKIQTALRSDQRILSTSFGRKNVLDLRSKIMIPAHLVSNGDCQIRTLHSLCYRHLKPEKTRNLTKHFVTHGHTQGFYFGSNRLRIVTNNRLDELDFRGSEPGTDHDLVYDELMRLRARMLPVSATTLTGRLADELHRMSALLQSGFDRGWWDFTFLIEEALRQDMPLQANLFCVDEVQDCSRLQIELLQRAKANEIIFVGDPDQAIHSWAGSADACDLKLLTVDTIENREQSWRVTNEIADYAFQTLKQASSHSPGRIRGKHRGGIISFDPCFENVCYRLQKDPSSWGDVFILGRTNYIAAKAQKIATEIGLNLSKSEEDETRQELLKIISHQTPTISHYQFRFLTSPVLDATVYYRRGAKAEMHRLLEEEPNGWMPWPAFFARFASAELKRVFQMRDTSFLIELPTQGSRVFNPCLPPVNCLTMHASKGLEADTVVLLRDSSERVLSHENHDEEVRLAYVAATRAKKRLVISSLDGPVMRQVLSSSPITS